MSVDFETLRSETPGASRIAHLNNCGASLSPRVVADAVLDHLRLEQAIGPYEAAAEAGERATALYEGAAKLIGCDASEVAFCDSASRGWNVIVYSLLLKPGDRVFVSLLEFGSALIAVQHVSERCGARVEVIPGDSDGRVSVDALTRMLSDGAPALVAVNHVAAHCGSVNPVREIGRLAKGAGAFYLVDACQSLGQMPVSVGDLQCDALVGTGRKWLRGPRGTGFLFMRRTVSTLIDPTTSDLVTSDYLFEPDGATGSRLKIRDDARKFELWERSVAGAIGLGVALDYLLSFGSSTAEIYARILDLAQYAADELRESAGVEVWAPRRAESGVVGFLVKGHSPRAVKEECLKRGVNISTMSDCDAPLDFHRRGSRSGCRLAAHYYNDRRDVDAVVRVIRDVARRA